MLSGLEVRLDKSESYDKMKVIVLNMSPDYILNIAASTFSLLCLERLDSRC